jgi:hypothetical protein
MGVVECPHCGVRVLVSEPETVRAGHNVASGEPRWWVIRAGGDEVHRCSEQSAPVGR